jgi:thioredoxin reductase
VDAFQRTNVAGVFAAGDLTRPFYNATRAAADGVQAGAAAHQSLLIDLPG